MTDITKPMLLSLVQNDSALTVSDVVHYTATFSEPVAGVGTGAFALRVSGVTGASIASVDPVAGSGGTQYLVAVNTGSGDGTLALEVTGAGIVDIAGNQMETGFQSATSYTVGDLPNQAAAGDLNGDGNADVVAGNFYGNTVSVLLGNGDGTFQNQLVFPAGGPVISLDIGDLNGDGRQDIAVIDYYLSGVVSVLLGNGDGTFQAPAGYSTGGVQTRFVAIGDLNGDGDLDLAVANLTSSTVAVLLGNGDGTFASPALFAGASEPVSVTVGDLNGDGALDLALANLYSDYASVLLGNGDGTFGAQSTYAVGSYPTFVTIGDANVDGRPDLVISNSGSDTFSVLLGNGDGTFATQVVYPTQVSPLSVEGGDFNGDGAVDLVVANASSDSALILLNLTPALLGAAYAIEKSAGVRVYDGTTLIGVYDTIQAAIDAPTTGSGATWTIHVIQANYNAGPESLLVTKDVTIDTDTNAGNNPNDETAGNERGPEVVLDIADIRASGVTIDGFTFTEAGLGISILDASNVTIRNNIFKGSSSGISADFSTPTPGNSTGSGLVIENNSLTSFYQANGISVTDYQGTSIVGNVFVGTGEFAIGLLGNTSNSTVSGNTASRYNAGVFVSCVTVEAATLNSCPPMLLPMPASCREVRHAQQSPRSHGQLGYVRLLRPHRRHSQ